MNAVIYVRVSTDEQGKGYSLPTQLETCRKYAVEKKFLVVAEFKDEFTGTELDRPGLNELRACIATKHVEHIIVHDLDRLARSVAYQLIFEQEVARLGIQIHYVLGQYAPTPEGDLMKHIKSAVAEYENAQRVERSRRGKEGKARAGQVICPSGRAPFGLNYRSERHKGWFEINEEQATIVQQMYQWINNGQSSYAIAKKLWERGILSKGDYSAVVIKKGCRGEWSPATVRRIISNPVYKGVWYYGKTRRTKVGGKTSQKNRNESEWIPVSVPAIVDEQIWEAAQACLARNKQESLRNTKREYLLRGMIFCQCGRRWTGRYKNHLNRAYYRCPTTEAEHWRNRCSMPGGILQTKIETAVWESVKSFLLDPKNLRAELSRRKADAEIENHYKLSRLQATEAAIAEVDRKMNMLLDQILTEGFARTVVDQRKNQLLTDRKALESEAEKTRGVLEEVIILPEQEEKIITFAEAVSRGLDVATFEKKRRLFELINLRVDVVSQKQVTVNCRISIGASVAISSA